MSKFNLSEKIQKRYRGISFLDDDIKVGDVKEFIKMVKLQYGLKMLMNDRLDNYNFGLLIDKLAGTDLQDKKQ